MGGASSEKDVSIKTGNAVIKALSSIYKEVTPMVVTENQDLAFLDDIGSGDIIFNALHGGFGENGDFIAEVEIWKPFIGDRVAALDVKVSFKACQIEETGDAGVRVRVTAWVIPAA